LRGENLIENLKRIQSGEVGEWLSEENKKWRCHEFGKPVSMQLTECHWCGTKIKL